MITTEKPTGKEDVGKAKLTTYQPSSMPRSKHGKTLLPSNFTPGVHSVVCGRGKACSTATGNRRLKLLINTFLDPYSKAQTKHEKTAIVSNIVTMVKQAARVGAFVKFEDGYWWEVEDCIAREKVGCLLRDRLHTQYRSSTKAKLARRKAQKAFDDLNSLNNSCHSQNSNSLGLNTSWHSRSNDSFALSSSNHSSSFAGCDSNIQSSKVGTHISLEQTVSRPRQITIPYLNNNEQLIATGGCGNSIQLVPPQIQSSVLPKKETTLSAQNSKLQGHCDSNSFAHRTNRLSYFREVLPMSSHLDVLGARAGESFSNCDKNDITSTRNTLRTDICKSLEEACDIVNPNGGDSDLPDDISDIFEDEDEDEDDISNTFDDW